MSTSPRRETRRGSALIIALALLSLFALMGTAYVKHVGLRAEDNNIELRAIHAATAAEAGVHATIGRIATILEQGGLVPRSERIDLPVYGTVKTNAHPENQGRELVALHARGAWAEVTIQNESGKVNVNHAPASVLRHLLGADGAAARALAEEARRQPFIALDELVTRGGLTEAQLAAIEPFVTVYTVTDHESPAGYIDLHSAPREVLAALFDINDEQALVNIETRRPTTLDQVCALAGDKNPATFNVALDPASPNALPPALTLTSRCFRLVSEGNFAHLTETVGGEELRDKGSTARVEAVVLFDLDGSYEILKWTTQRNHLS